MANKSRTSYEFYYEEQYKIYKQKGITGNEATKQIGQMWSSLSPQERKPYEDKKIEYQNQIQREQEVMKNFQKKKNLENSKDNRENYSSNQAAQTQNKDSNNETSKIVQTNLKRFTKQELQKDKAETTKKVLIQKVDNKGKVIASNSLQNQAQQQQQTQKQTQQLPKKTEQSTQQIQKPQQKQSQQQPQNKQEDAHKQKASGNQESRGNHSVYIQFYKERLADYKKRFPSRKVVELTQAIKEEWNCQKLVSKIEQKEKKQEKKLIKQSVPEKEKLINIDGKQVEVPKKPISGFMRYYKEVQGKIKQQNQSLQQNEIAKLASEQWKNLTKEKQDQYNSEFHKEQGEYNKKIAELKQKYNITPQNSVKETKKHSKNFIIINESKVYYPIRLGGYFVFQKQAREQLKDKKASYDSRDISSIIGKLWKVLPSEEKEKYEQQSEIEYEGQKRDFIKKYGTFPEQPARAKPNPTVKVQNKQLKEVKKLNQKRPAPSKIVEPEISMEEKEELLKKKHQRKMQINYDNVDSEIEDIYSQIDESEQMRKEEYEQEEEEQEQEEYGNYYKNKVSLKTKGEEDFEKIEKYFTKNKKVKTEQPNKEIKPSSKPGSVSKPKNSLFDMLNQPIAIPDFVYGPNFF